MTEDEMESAYSNYDVQSTYMYSEYPAGTVLSQDYDATTGTITSVVSQGPDPSTQQEDGTDTNTEVDTEVDATDYDATDYDATADADAYDATYDGTEDGA